MAPTDTKTDTCRRLGGEMFALVDKPRICSAATLSGYLVRSEKHEDLGCIEELMIHPPSGRIVYAILSFGGLLGHGGKLYAVPWSALCLDPDQRMFVLDVAREQLETAPTFNEENWPDLTDPDWSDKIHQHFGLHPQPLAA